MRFSGSLDGLWDKKGGKLAVYYNIEKFGEKGKAGKR
jgi:hypothetical protein